MTFKRWLRKWLAIFVLPWQMTAQRLRLSPSVRCSSTASKCFHGHRSLPNERENEQVCGCLSQHLPSSCMHEFEIWTDNHPNKKDQRNWLHFWALVCVFVRPIIYVSCRSFYVSQENVKSGRLFRESPSFSETYVFAVVCMPKTFSTCAKCPLVHTHMEFVSQLSLVSHQQKKKIKTL